MVKKKNPAPGSKILTINKIEDYLSPKLIQLYQQKIEVLENLGYQVEKITIPKRIRDHLQITYLILCSSELVSHLNSLQGVTYGTKDNINITQKRSKHLGRIVKQRLLIGAYFLENRELFVKAQKVRYLVDEWVKKIFQKENFLIFPAPSSPAPRADSFLGHNFTGLISSHWSDNLLLIANFSGLPSLSLPIGLMNGLPVSININGAYGKDKQVLELATKLEK